MRSIFEKQGGTYSRHGDYLLPDFKLPEQEENVTLGKWGHMHRRYLKKHKRVLYYNLLTSGKLMQYCKEVEDLANERFNLIVNQLARAEGITESLKETDQIAWVQAMNSIRNRAEEIIKTELIFR